MILTVSFNRSYTAPCKYNLRFCCFTVISLMPHYNGFVCQTNFMRLIQYLLSTSIIFSKKTKRFMERNWRNRWVHKLLIGEVQTLAYFYSKLMIYRLYEFHRILICNSECFLFTQKVCKLHQIVKYVLFNRFWFVEILKKKV